MTELRKSLGLMDLTMIAIGATIGSGIFATPASVAQELPSPFWILLAWVLGGVISLTGSFTYAELSGKFPGAGGLYVYLKEGFGNVWGFLYGWATLLIINTGSIAALALIFARYSAILWTYFTGIEVGASGIIVIAMVGIVVVTLVNIAGVKQAGTFSNIFTGLKLLGIGMLIVVGIFFATGAGDVNTYGTAIPPLKNGFGAALGLVMVSVLWSFGGWYHASFVAGEAKNPRVTVPWAMVIATVIITVIYLLCNVAYMNLLPLDQIANAENKEVAAAAVKTVMGETGMVIIAFVIFISTFGTTGIYTLTAPRIYYTMAQDGIFFKKIGQLSEKTQVPINAIVLQTFWSLVLVAVWGTFQGLIEFVLFTEWIFLAMAGIAIFVFRMRDGKPKDHFRSPGYPVVPIIFCVCAVAFIFSQVLANYDASKSAKIENVVSGNLDPGKEYRLYGEKDFKIEYAGKEYATDSIFKTTEVKEYKVISGKGDVDFAEGKGLWAMIQPFAGLLIILIGVVVYQFWRKRALIRT